MLLFLPLSLLSTTTAPLACSLLLHCVAPLSIYLTLFLSLLPFTSFLPTPLTTMSSVVRFAEGTKDFDSPSKAFNGNSNHTNAKTDLARNRGELCFNMHGKITIVKYKDLVRRFLPSFHEHTTTSPNIFRALSKPKSEKNMYERIVSFVSLLSIEGVWLIS